MIKSADCFEAWVLEDPPAECREETVLALREHIGTHALILDTCQRLELYGVTHDLDIQLGVLEKYSAKEAFERMVRIAAGLDSRVLGELEILGQVRNAYKTFQQVGGRVHSRLDRVYQDALQIARKARRESGVDQQLTSLSGLTARMVLDEVPAGAPVAVIGSGSLAGSVVRYLSKRGKSPIRVAGRCPEKALQLAVKAGGFSAGLNDLSELLEGVHAVIAATAAPHPVLYAHHLDNSDHRLVVADLGVPADCNTCIRDHHRVRYYGLEDIETRSMQNLEERQRRAAVAEQIIRDGVDAWCARC